MAGRCDDGPLWRRAFVATGLPWTRPVWFGWIAHVVPWHGGISQTLLYSPSALRPKAVEMFAAALREETHRELISVGDSNDCWTQCGFFRVSMKSLLWLWLLRLWLRLWHHGFRDCAQRTS